MVDFSNSIFYILVRDVETNRGEIRECKIHELVAKLSCSSFDNDKRLLFNRIRLSVAGFDTYIFSSSLRDLSYNEGKFTDKTGRTIAIKLKDNIFETVEDASLYESPFIHENMCLDDFGLDCNDILKRGVVLSNDKLKIGRLYKVNRDTKQQNYISFNAYEWGGIKPVVKNFGYDNLEIDLVTGHFIFCGDTTNVHLYYPTLEECEEENKLKLLTFDDFS